MALLSSRSLAFVLSAFGTLCVAPGCVDDGVSMHVICPIQPEVDEGACLWSADGEVCVTQGALNLRSAQRYLMGLRVQSGLKARNREVPPMGEPNGVQLVKARIELRTVDGARIAGFGMDPRTKQERPNPFDAVATGFLQPGGFNVTTLTVIPGEYLEGLEAAYNNPLLKLREIVASIQLKGETTGSLDVESGEFLWPIRLDASSTAKGSGCIDPEGLDVCGPLVGQDDWANLCR